MTPSGSTGITRTKVVRTGITTRTASNRDGRPRLKSENTFEQKNDNAEEQQEPHVEGQQEPHVEEQPEPHVEEQQEQQNDNVEEQPEIQQVQQGAGHLGSA
ncbi:unnamed protein product [Amoebophrya sp. A25]|nr:unnamed protein product [Amoebophrya sp. A25]|eukprot:GSA25T00027294001.1